MRDLIDLYMESLGDSEVPPPFHYWSFLGLVGAVIAPRTYLSPLPVSWKKIRPNLFVWLIGPPASGKDSAIERILPLLHSFSPEALPRFMGRTSVEALIDYMTAGRENLLFVAPELANSVSPLQAPGMVKFLTDMWSGKREWSEHTRKSGFHTFQVEPCLSCIFGTTRSWAFQVVTEEDIRGGYFGRVMPVEVEFDSLSFLDRGGRLYRPTRMPSPTLLEEVQERLFDLFRLEGAFVQAEDALKAEEAWYMGRPGPAGEEFLSSWRRAPEMVWKLEMILTAAETGGKVIRRHHVEKAIQLVEQLHRALPRFMEAAAESKTVRGISRLRAYLEKERQIFHSDLVRLASRWGIGVDALHKLMATLIEGGEVYTNGWKGGRGPERLSYHWKGRGGEWE